ncbi:olfactory receptor family 5 subfamily K member 4 [Homo sapiens]|jgi:olfactory receptor|uniref:Olfactory receptor 5K4 n=1 Tax=Homo sapiens TaxID=9606 RepID=OR5K4_HUMAN|nr:olfactory receptor 5K4 [Homo sapiens]A6NMS3.1 RecName: Full=Olfactory receptor 5K4 [Homo sapiens]EAW79864.1 olfactory receptor, family 5, subfamily K, member 4 [Homo sapiens]KAI2530561.1 olfactory receptor family 5 subfamily K member 4 [Homo sapiens]KAI4030624.1 olfactory receptor family 5 subfamily K member 4 [Homo sapiens]|eukprot:NP_001005517.1 olfactory receptor 5K4 [Homo sapiens]
MARENHSLAAEFILIGFTNYPELKTLLFVVFSAIYLVTMVGNLGLVALIYVERRLLTPMYIFLGNLALMDSCCSCAVTPKMLENFFSEDRIISLYECMAQFYFLCLAETTDCFLLATMAYDRYVAICHPLQYHTMMSKTLCIRMTTGAFKAGNLHSMIHVGLLLRLTFCRSNKIHHFFCDILPLYRLSCTDPSINELMIYIFSIPIQIFTIATVLISYLCILLTVFKMKSKEGRGKAFSTCASHFLSVSIFYICLLMYIGPSEEGDKDTPVAIFYAIVIPLLNPFIYSLRNKEVINVLKKIMRNYNILKQTCSIANLFLIY